MKITVLSNEFKNAIEKCLIIADTKKQKIDPLLFFTTDSDKNIVSIMGTDLQQYISIEINAISTNSRSFCIPDIKTLLKSMKYFDKHDDIILEFDNEKVTLTCGTKTANTMCYFDVDIPKSPLLNEELTNDSLYSNSKLKERINKIKYAVGTDSSSNNLRCIHFNDIDVVSCDGFRLAINSDNNLTTITPYNVKLNVVKNVIGIMGEKINISTDDKTIQFCDDINKITIVSHLCKEKYPNYRALLTTNHEYRINSNIKSFIDALKFLKTIKNTKENFCVNWKENTLSFVCGKNMLKTVVDEANPIGTDILFNGDYMIEVLSQFDDTVDVYLNTDISPIVFESSVDCSNKAILLPISKNRHS